MVFIPHLVPHLVPGLGFVGGNSACSDSPEETVKWRMGVADTAAKRRTFLIHPCQQGVRKPRLLFFLVTEETRMSAQKGWGGWEGGGKLHEGSQNGLKFFNLFVWMPWFPTCPALDRPLVRGTRSAGRGPCCLLLLGRGGSAQGGLQSWRRTPGRGRGEEGRAVWGTNIWGRRQLNISTPDPQIQQYT